MSAVNLDQTVRSLAAKAAGMKGKPVNEQNTKAALIEPMLAALGWDLHDLGVVQQQFRPTSKDNPADYALHVGGSPVLVVEAKALGTNLSAWSHVTQALGYAMMAGAAVCVLTDGNSYHLYNAVAALPAQAKLFGSLRLTDQSNLQAATDLLRLLERSSFQRGLVQRAWERLTADRIVHRAVRDLLDGPDPALIELVARRSPAMVKSVVGEALGRQSATLRPPEIDLTELTDEEEEEDERTTASPGRATAQVLLAQLVKRWGLTPPVRLRRVYLDKLLEAELLGDGSIRFGGQSYPAPTPAALAAMAQAGSTGSTENGWRFWRMADAPHTGAKLEHMRDSGPGAGHDE